MIPFKGLKMCPRCEQPIVIGGYLMLPKSDVINHYCFKCALHETQAYYEEQGKTIDSVQFLSPDDLDD